jgi:hypothetical protein
MNAFFGIPIIVDETLPIRRRVQFRFPKSRRKRIRKKWAKQPENFRTETTHAVFVSPGALQRAGWHRSGFVVSKVVEADLRASVVLLKD